MQTAACLKHLPLCCAGYLDAGLKLQNSLTAPAVGGDVRLSRGVASLMPGGPSPPGGSGGGSNGASSSGSSGQQSGLGALLDGGRARETDLVFKAFTVLTGKDALARQLSRFDMQQARPSTALPRALSREHNCSCNKISFKHGLSAP